MRALPALVLALLLVVLTAPVAAAAVDPAAVDPAADERVVAADPVSAAIAVSRLRHVGGGRAPRVVLARSDLFADALAASPLLDRGVLLLTPGDHLPGPVADEVDRVLAPGGEVVVAGGPAAVAEDVVAALRRAGHAVRRVRGEDRAGTAAAMAVAAVALGADPTEVLLVRGHGPGTAAWADSVVVAPHAAHARVPVLLTRTDTLPAATRDWFDGHAVERTVVVGGTAAVADSVAAGVPGARRVAGPRREETSVAVARDLVGVTASAPRALGVFDARADDGWAWGLLAASRVADLGGALLAVATDVEAAQVTALLRSCDVPRVRLFAAGGRGDVSDVQFSRLNLLDGRCPGPDGTTREGFAVSAVHVGAIGVGPVRRYSIEVEPQVGVDLAELRDVVYDALLDERSWARTHTLEQVGPGAAADVRIVLARPATVDRHCARVGLRTGGRFSCWDGARAMLNADRYRTGAAPFADDLATYRRYLVNHEVGHGLGRGHTGCPRSGALAPVMMQQTKGVGGCVPNGWPFP